MSRRRFLQGLIVSLTAACLLASSGAASAQGQGADAFERVKAVQERHTQALMARPGVVGTAIGLNPGGRYVVLVLLEEEGVPNVPADLEGVPVRRFVTGKIHALPKPQKPPGQGGVPAAPTALVAVAAGTSRIDLSWQDNAKNEDGFEIWRSESLGDFQLAGTTRKNRTSFTDTGLAAGTLYTYHVCAYNESGLSDFAEASATTESDTPPDTEPPAAPTNLDTSSVGSTEVGLDWDANTEPDLAHYNVYRSTVPGTYGEPTAANITTNAHTDTGLTPGTLYYYVVTAVDGSGNESAHSDEISVTTQADTEAPAAPTGLSAAAVSASQIDLTWSASTSSDVAGYNVYRSETDGGPYGPLQSGVTGTQYSDTGLTASTTYYYVVTAVDTAANESGNSNQASATTDSATEPPTDPTERFPRPVPIGVSTGHFSITAGTIACRVRDGQGNVYALSNNHVYAAENAANIGDPVLQPGTFDGGTVANDTLGTLHDYEPVYMYPWGLNTIDAAIASVTTGDLGQSTLSAGYGTPATGVVVPSLGMAVQKYGRTTRLTQGTVTGLNATIFVQYSTGIAIFTGQIMIEGTGGSFSAGGDSGSLVVTTDTNCNPVGLLFAGSSTVTYANLISPVLSRFLVTVDGK